MPLATKDQWFVVHVLSGQESKVQENINRRIQTEEMGDHVFEVLIPTERVQEIKRGKKTETTRKFFPGYIIVNMYLLDEDNQLVEKTWYFIKNTTGVLGFADHGKTALSDVAAFGFVLGSGVSSGADFVSICDFAARHHAAFGSVAHVSSLYVERSPYDIPSRRKTPSRRCATPPGLETAFDLAEAS